MDIGKIFKSPSLLSAIAIFFLLSSCIITIIYNQLPTVAKAYTDISKFFMGFSVSLLIFFFISFTVLFVSILQIEEIWDFISEPAAIVTVTSAILICSYLSSVMNSYVIKIYGSSHVLSGIFLVLSIVFFVFFIILFVSMLVTFSKKFLYSPS